MAFVPFEKKKKNNAFFLLKNFGNELKTMISGRKNGDCTKRNFFYSVFTLNWPFYKISIIIIIMMSGAKISLNGKLRF